MRNTLPWGGVGELPQHGVSRPLPPPPQRALQRKSPEVCLRNPKAAERAVGLALQKKKAKLFSCFPHPVSLSKGGRGLFPLSPTGMDIKAGSCGQFPAYLEPSLRPGQAEMGLGSKRRTRLVARSLGVGKRGWGRFLFSSFGGRRLRCQKRSLAFPIWEGANS